MKFYLPLFLIFFVSAACAADSPFDDAVAVWHMDAPDDLTVVGDVEFNVALPEAEIAASKLRGGDGKAVRIPKGAYLSAGQGTGGKLNITGQQMTICLRLRAPGGEWDCPIFAKHGGHDRLAYNVFSSAERLGCEFGTSENRGVMAATVPFDELLPRGEESRTAWHDVICRVDGAKLELFVDGRCVDEEFMLGELRVNDLPLLVGAESHSGHVKTGFDGLVDHAAVWDRALTDAEILALSGGEKFADTRQRTDRGIPGESLQYWRPPNRYFVGDTLPFYDEKAGVFHFVYLLDKAHHRAKNGFGAHQWAQATSTDLVNWTHQPLLLPVTAQWEGSICTGSVFIHDGTFYAFYATRAYPGKPAPDGKTYEGEFAAYATSTDGIHFVKQTPNPLVILPGDAGYSRAGRDPVVFRDERDGRFHMYITSNFKGAGCWAHLVSRDLKTWELLEPVLAGGGDPECPDWFRWGDTYYLIVNWGNGFYRVSKSATGPWEKPAGPDILMPGAPRVPKTAAYKDGRRMITGWTNEVGFGGHAVFHELIRHEDGTLGEKFVPEMLPKTEAPVVAEAEITVGEYTAKAPGDFRFQAVLEFDPEEADALPEWTLTYCVHGDTQETLRVVPAERAIYLGSRNHAKIAEMDFCTGRLAVDMFVKNAVVDVCVNDTRTATNTLPGEAARTLKIRQDTAKYRLKDVRVSPVIMEIF